MEMESPGIRWQHRLLQQFLQRSNSSTANCSFSQQSFLYGQEVHKIPKATEITDLELYLTDPSDPTDHAERFPHPTMTLFAKPALGRNPRLANGRDSAHTAASKTSAAGRKAPRIHPSALEKLKKDMANEQKAKKEHSYVWLGRNAGLGQSVLTRILFLVLQLSMLRSVTPVPSVPLQSLARPTSSFPPRAVPWPAPLAGLRLLALL